MIKEVKEDVIEEKNVKQLLDARICMEDSLAEKIRKNFEDLFSKELSPDKLCTVKKHKIDTTRNLAKEFEFS